MPQHRVSNKRIRRRHHDEETYVTPNMSQSFHTPNINMIRNEVITIPPSSTPNFAQINSSNNSYTECGSNESLIENNECKWCCC